MDNTYTIQKDTVLEILQEIDVFKERMNSFIEKHPEYEYTVNGIIKTGDKYTTSINVKKDEHGDNKIL